MSTQGETSFSKLLMGAIVGLGVFSLTACGGGGGGGGNGGPVDPSDSNAMTDALGVKLGNSEAERVTEGDPPQSTASDDPDSPTVDGLPSGDQDVEEQGETKEISFDANTSGDSVLAALYAKVTGSDNGYFVAETSQTQAFTKQSDGSLVFAFEIPDNLGAGRFCIEISAMDSEERVSDPGQVCFTFEPPENDPVAVQQRLQGSWERCIEGERERLDIESATINSMITEFSGSNCTGDVLSTDQSVLTFEVGSAITTGGGMSANELDLFIESSPNNPDEEGQTSLDIVRVTSDELTFGDGGSAPQNGRPTRLDFERSYQSIDPSQPGGGDPQTATGTWKLSFSGTVTQDGQTENVPQTDIGEVPGEAVVFVEPDNQQELEQEFQFAQNFEQGFEQACNPFEGDAGVREFSFDRSGDGAVGTVVDLFIDFFIDGTCTQDGETQPIDFDAQLTYRWERIE